MITTAKVRGDRRKRQREIWSRFLDVISTGSVYVALVVGIGLGKMLQNYQEGMTWADLTIPTSLDIIVTVILTLPTTYLFEQTGISIGKIKNPEAVKAGKKRNTFKRCMMAFFTGLGTQHIAGTVQGAL